MPKRILIFDDDIDILSICTYLLQALGWEVHTRLDCNNILEVIKEVAPHVIVMDNRIPGTGGIIATQTIKEHSEFKSIPVIYFSANHDIKNLSLEAGAEMYIEKPFDISKFEKIINSVITPG